MLRVFLQQKVLRLKKKSEAKDRLFVDRASWGQRPRTQFWKCSPEEKIGHLAGNAHFLRNFGRSPKEKVIEPETEFKVTLSLISFRFHESKNSAVLEPRTGHYRGLVSFAAKDLSFAAKTKDFNMCPRGLHLCHVYSIRSRSRKPHYQVEVCILMSAMRSRDVVSKLYWNLG